MSSLPPAKSPKNEKFLNEVPVEATVEAVLCDRDPTSKKKVLGDIRLTFERPGTSSTATVSLRAATETWSGTQASSLEELLGTEAGQLALVAAISSDRGANALRAFFLTTPQGSEVLSEALASPFGRALIRQILHEVVLEVNKQQRGELPKSPSSSDDDVEILGTVPAPGTRAGDSKPAAQLPAAKTNATPPPKTVTTGNSTTKKRRTPTSDDDEESWTGKDPAIIKILVLGAVGQWKTRDAAVEHILQRRGIETTGVNREIEFFLATLNEHRRVSRLPRKDLALVAYVDDFKTRMKAKYPGETYLHQKLDAEITVETKGKTDPDFESALAIYRKQNPRNGRI